MSRLLLRFVDFQWMTTKEAVEFSRKLDSASDEQVAEALNQLLQQTRGIVTNGAVTALAVKMMERLHCRYTIVRTHLQTGEKTVYGNQGFVLDTADGEPAGDDLPV